VFFIFRMIFWMIVVMLILPTPRVTTPDRQEDVSIRSLAAKAASAATSYCVENADNCAAGLETARTLAASFEKTAPREDSLPATPPARAIVLPPPRPAIR